MGIASQALGSDGQSTSRLYVGIQAAVGRSGSFGTTEDRYNRGDNLADGFRLQYPNYTLHQIAARGEELAGPCIARDLQRTLLEIGSLQNNRGTVGIGLTGDLTQNPVAATGIGQHYSRTQFSL